MMLFNVPPTPELYQALLDRDPRFDGRVWVCVITTGIFCRLTCPARKPLAENCIFEESPAACLNAGFRPCKRCTPLTAAAAQEPAIVALLEALEARPDHRWSEQDVAALGHDLSTIRRGFKRHFGMTFLEMARLRRIRAGFEALGQGERVIDAQIDAGFDSPSAFRAGFAKALGLPPADLRPGGALQASWIATPLGDMIAVASQTYLHLLEFLDRKALPAELKRLRADAKGDLGLGRLPPVEQAEAELADFFALRAARFQTPLHQPGSGFSQSVWAALCAIPAGQTRSYAQLARDLGRDSAVRAVARANGANQIALLVPCHRVIGADGALTGYGGGLWRKQRLLEIERYYAA